MRAHLASALLAVTFTVGVLPVSMVATCQLWSRRRLTFIERGICFSFFPGMNVGKVKVHRRVCASLQIKHPTRTTLEPKTLQTRTTSCNVNAGGHRSSWARRAAIFIFCRRGEKK